MGWYQKLNDRFVKNQVGELQNGQGKHLTSKQMLYTVVGALLLFIIFLIIGGGETPPAPKQQAPLPTPTAPEQQQKSPLNIGDAAVLRMNNDPTAIVFLATTPEANKELIKVIQANDAVGLLELGAQGKAFGITNGAKIKIIDRSLGLRKVRIVEGIKSVDQDKVGQSGWVPYEWVVAQ